MNKTHIAVIYARVSSINQDIEKSTQVQVKACQDYAKERTLKLYIYSDKAESGTYSNRPEFQRMVTDAR